MELYRVSFFGHSKIIDMMHVDKMLDKTIESLLRKHEFVEFYVGKNGDFDILAASAVKRAQKKLGRENSALMLVLPYHMKDEADFANFYDEIVLPVNSHPKSAFTKRNRWMVENSDMIVAFVEEEHGGAFQTLKYAEKQNKRIINLSYHNADTLYVHHESVMY